MDVNSVRQSSRPCVQTVQLSFRVHRRLDRRDKSREGTYVDANRVPAGDQGLNECGPTSDMGVEAQIAGLCKCLDGGADECGTETGGVLVVPVREAANWLRIASTRDKRDLSALRKLRYNAPSRFAHG